MFTIVFKQQAAKKLEKINEPYFSSIKKEVLLLQKNYFPGEKNCKKLHGKEKDFYRLRTGTYRILYHVGHTQKLITILRIFHRNEGY